MGLAISSLQLKNGLRVVLVRDERASEVAVTMRYDVGAKDDPPGQEGVAHLVEHLMFQQVLGGQTLYAKLQTFTTFMNAFTSVEGTWYQERAKASHLDEMLSVEAVRVGFRCTSVTDSAFVRERQVVLNELALRGGGEGLREAIQDEVYPDGHPYRHRVGGTPASVGAITREQACAFADAHYAPKNAVLVVSGNIAPKTLEEGLGKFIARVARRDAIDSVPVPPLSPTSRAVEIRGAVDDELLVITWPMPSDLAERAKLMAIRPLLVAEIGAKVEGAVQYLGLGDRSAPTFGVAITLGEKETVEKATAGVKKALADLPRIFRVLGKVDLGEMTFDGMKQQAIYASYARLDDTLERDAELANYVLAGLDPAQAAGQAFAGLRELDRNDASRIAAEVLRFDHATVVVVKPAFAKKLGRETTIAADIHDIGQHRDPPDPAEAGKPALGDAPATTVPGMTTRVLPNGLKVVLLPVTSVPTVDVRLVFGAGTADELPNKRGAAIVAARALTWDARYVNDYLAFFAAGGSDKMAVDRDAITFSARGLDMHIDVLLAGLRRWVRDGRYRSGEATIREALDAQSRGVGDGGELTAAWRGALYGEQHPYTRGGLARYASPDLSLDDVKEFRRAHFTPDNATLVISGRFDGPLADRWIDFLFADWKGTAATRVTTRAAPSVASLARDADAQQMGVMISIPVRTGTRAQQLVAAQMLDEIVEDIRHQLGASYVLSAELAEQRLATNYLVAGTVDSTRTKEALELVRARLEKLAREPEATASAFVAARTRVISTLSASEGTAGALAGRVASDASLGRPPLADLATAAEVHRMTFAEMSGVLGDLDLAAAAISLVGQQEHADAAFAALGRTAQHIARTETEKKVAKKENKDDDDDDRISLSELASPLTGQPRSTRFRVTAMPFALATGRVLGHGVSGYSFALGAELRLDQVTSIGLVGSIGFLDGTYVSDDLFGQQQSAAVLPLSIGASVGSSAYDRVWGRFSLAFHANRVTDDKMPSAWDTGLGLGLLGGVDILKLGRHRAGLFGSLESDLFTTASTAVLSLGIAYRY